MSSSTPFDALSAAAGVTEIRVHGVGGATPEQMLGQAAPRQVSGDRLAGFYRLDEQPNSRRHVEAYSWGGLTSRSRSRALWVFLLPFVLANMAGWASRPRSAAVPGTGEPGQHDAGAKAGPIHGFRIAAAKMAGLALTLSVLLMVCLLSIDVLGYQCGSQQLCAESSWWLAPLTWGDLLAYPSRRLVIGSLVPLAVIAVFAILSFTSRTRYERIDPPGLVKKPEGAAAKSQPPPIQAHQKAEKPEESAENSRSAVYLPDGLADQRFWEGRAAHARLSRVHLSAGIAVVAFVLGLCSLHTAELAAGYADHTALRAVGFGLAGVALALGIVLLQRDWERPWPSAGALVLAMAGFVAVGWSAWLQPAATSLQAGQTPGIVLAFNLTWILIGLLLLALLLTLKVNRDASIKGVFRWLQPFPMLVFGVLVAHIVLLGVLVFVTGLVSPVTPPENDPTEPLGCLSQVPIAYLNEIHCAVTPGGPPIPLMLPPMVATSISYFVWLGLLLLALFAAFGLFRYWWAGRGKNLGRLKDDQRPPVGCDGQQSGSVDDCVDDYHDEEVEIEKLPEEDDRRVWRQDAVTQQTPDNRAATGWRFALRRNIRKRVIDRKEEWVNATRWDRRRARWEFLGRASAGVSWLIAGMVFVAVCVVIPVWIIIFILGDEPPAFGAELAATIAISIPPALFAFIVLSWRQLERRRILGTLWDVGTFWPRSFHPFAPPCYAERAVPELTRRVWWLNNNKGNVVLAAHSQGAVIAAAIALRADLSRPNGPRFGLVTFGAPLRKLYGQAFPAYWSVERIKQLSRPNQSLVLGLTDGSSQSSSISRWTNVYYLTDYIGGAVDVGGVDRRLPDPAHRFYVYGQPPDKVMSHTGYWNDPKFRDVVDTMMNHIDPPQPPQQR